MERSIALIDDLIEIEKARDIEFKKLALQANRESLAVGDSAMIYHLKNLKELIQVEYTQKLLGIRNDNRGPH